MKGQFLTSFIIVTFFEACVSIANSQPSDAKVTTNPTVQEVHPAPVNEYGINADGGMIYDPLTREASKTGQADEYRDVPCIQQQLTLGGCNVQFQIPKKGVPYDTIPISYSLSWKPGTQFPIAIEATGFQDEKRCSRSDLYDLTLPHHIALSAQYTGSVTAKVIPEAKHNITVDFSDTPKNYPNFVCSPLVHSGTVATGDLIWFQFHLTNTGDTILGSEGFGGSLLFPELLRKDANGIYQHFAYSTNRYYRNTRYWYPGEAWDPWILFLAPSAPNDPPESYRLPVGEYKIRIQLAYRSYKTVDAPLNYWDGAVAYTFDQPVSMEASAKQTPVVDGAVQPSAGDYPDKLPTFIHTFEQFLTSFDLYLKAPSSSDQTVRASLHLQLAPWTRSVVLKLIGTNPNQITTAVVPIEMDNQAAKLAIKPDMRNVVVQKDGQTRPAFATQIMSDMRANVQVGPHPEKVIIDDLQNMKNLGVNLVCTTEGGWYYTDRSKPASDFAGDAQKYALDVARQMGLQVTGWGLYPPFSVPSFQQEASWFSGKDFNTMDTMIGGYGPGAPSITPMERRFGEAYADIVLYNFTRWGDLFYQNGNGEVPIDIEDTRGWMRDDINAHFPVGATGLAAFRKWAQNKYQTIENADKAWGTNYTTFDAITPETGDLDVGFAFSYKNQSHPFHEWNNALADYDEFRTEARLTQYGDILTNLRKTIPGATIEIRTEGANVIADGIDPESPDAHFRHLYYSQQRCALVAKPIIASGLVRYHSDYTTLPYTPSELRYLVRTSVKQGIVPTYLPEFCDMRDIAVNDRYGNDYQIDYNLSGPAKGYMMHVLTASYPWYKIMDEEGGVPGLLWEDFECDGFVTETQEKEMRFFQQKLDQSLAGVSEIHQGPESSQSWRKGSRAMNSYSLPILK
jgi:Beta-galactosidase